MGVARLMASMKQGSGGVRGRVVKHSGGFGVSVIGGDYSKVSNLVGMRVIDAVLDEGSVVTAFRGYIYKYRKWWGYAYIKAPVIIQPILKPLHEREVSLIIRPPCSEATQGGAKGGAP